MRRKIIGLRELELAGYVVCSGNFLKSGFLVHEEVFNEKKNIRVISAQSNFRNCGFCIKPLKKVSAFT